MIKIDKDLINLSNLLSRYAPLYVVGGYVRDSLLGNKVCDVDLCSCLSLNTLQEILKDTAFKLKITNKTFGTCKIICNKNTWEYTTFRNDTYKPNGKHSPSKVEFVLDLKLDAKRRDFTINCIYYDILNNKLIDIYNGIQDLKEGVIKALPPCEETLKVDGERLLRMVKYAVKYNFKIDEETFSLAKKYANNIQALSKNTIDKFINYFNELNIKAKESARKLFKNLGLIKIAEQIT